MGRAPCCDKSSVKRGPWSPEEDAKLKQYIQIHGTAGNWIAFPHKAGIKRCGKSCRLRWLNYLRPNIKHGDFTHNEDRIICSLFTSIGSRWSIIAAQLPGRTDNDIKNYWNTKLKKKLSMGLISIPNIKLKPNPAVAVLSNFSQISLPSSPAQQTAANVWSFVDPAANPSPSYNSGLEGTLNNIQILHPYYYDCNQQENILSFGVDHQASCSSSDGSCGGNQLGYGGGEMEYDYGRGGQMGYIQNVLNDSVVEDHEQQELVMVSKSGVVKKEDQSGVWKEETPLECSLEEINRLISSNNNNNNNNNNNVSFDENYTSDQERFMYY